MVVVTADFEAYTVHKDAPADTDDPITPKADPLCVVCDTPIPWKGNGFRPKYCTDHRTYGHQRGAKTDGAKPSAGPKRNNAAINRAVETLELLYGMTGTALALTVAPKLGARVVEDRGELAESYRMLLESNARVRAWFAEVEGKAAWLPILVAHGDLAANVMLAAKTARMERQAASWPTDTDGYGVPPRPDGV